MLKQVVVFPFLNPSATLRASAELVCNTCVYVLRVVNEFALALSNASFLVSSIGRATASERHWSWVQELRTRTDFVATKKLFFPSNPYGSPCGFVLQWVVVFFLLLKKRTKTLYNIMFSHVKNTKEHITRTGESMLCSAYSFHMGWN